MTKPRTLTISGPFDPRHVSGVTIPGVITPAVGQENATTVSGLEPDETPSHTFVAQGNIEVPRRSNTIAISLGRPVLRLRTSFSMLRGQSGSASGGASTPEPDDRKTQRDTPVVSLRKKSSTSRPWARTAQDAHTTSPIQSLRKKPSSSALWIHKRHAPEAKKQATGAAHSPPRTSTASSRVLSAVALTHSPLDSDIFSASNFGEPLATPTDLLKQRTTAPMSTAPRAATKSSDPSASIPSNPSANPYSYNPSAPAPPPAPKPHAPALPSNYSQPLQTRTKPAPPVRPKRADSGVAVDHPHHENAPTQERPLGFMEILAVSSYDERMQLYKRMREYWAHVDHGLDDWVAKRAVGVRV